MVYTVLEKIKNVRKVKIDMANDKIIITTLPGKEITFNSKEISSLDVFGNVMSYSIPNLEVSMYLLGKENVCEVGEFIDFQGRRKVIYCSEEAE